MLKQSDIFTIIIVATIGMLGAFFLSDAILGNPDMEKTTFSVVEPITDSIMQPDAELFNSKAINPTVEVEIGVCEDTNGNGILDVDERAKCLGQNTGDTAKNTESDGESSEW